MSIINNPNLVRVAKYVVEIATVTGIVSLLEVLRWSSLTLHGLSGPLSIAVCSWALFSVRLLVQQKILTGSFFTSSCPIDRATKNTALAAAIAAQVAAIVLAAVLFPANVAIDGVLAYALVTVVAFFGGCSIKYPQPAADVLGGKFVFTFFPAIQTQGVTKKAYVEQHTLLLQHQQELKMRKGSKKAVTLGEDNAETAEEAAALKGAARDTELRAQASKHGATRARLVLKQRCGTISDLERVALVAAHIDFGAVRSEQGHEAQAEDIFRDAFNLSRDLLRRGESVESLQVLIGRLPKDLQKALTAPALPAPTVRAEETVAPRPRAQRPIQRVKPVKVSLTPRVQVSDAVAAKTFVRRRGRRSMYNRSMSGY